MNMEMIAWAGVVRRYRFLAGAIQNNAYFVVGTLDFNTFSNTHVGKCDLWSSNKTNHVIILTFPWE